MHSQSGDTRRGLFVKMTGGLVFAVGIRRSANAAQQISIVARSGQEASCSHQGYYRVDANGKEWPVTIQYAESPKTEPR
jgi:hypothetical protein